MQNLPSNVNRQETAKKLSRALCGNDSSWRLIVVPCAKKRANGGSRDPCQTLETIVLPGSRVCWSPWWACLPALLVLCAVAESREGVVQLAIHWGVFGVV